MINNTALIESFATVLIETYKEYVGIWQTIT